MLASATSNIAIALGTSGVGIAILVVLRSRSKRPRVSASPEVETVVDKSPVVVPEVVIPEVTVAPSVREKAGRTRSCLLLLFNPSVDEVSTPLHGMS